MQDVRLYKNKNLGGGVCYEFLECCKNLIIAVKNRDDQAVKIQFNKLDNWGLEMYKQNILIKWGQNDKTPGVATIELNKLLNSWL